MPLPFNCFDPASAHSSEHHRNVYAIYELLYTLADFSAAALFLAGSILFFDESTVNVATWLFVFGSALFCIKPTLRLTREIHLWRIGNKQELAKRARSEL